MNLVVYDPYQAWSFHVFQAAETSWCQLVCNVCVFAELVVTVEVVECVPSLSNQRS